MVSQHGFAATKRRSQPPMTAEGTKDKKDKKDVNRMLGTLSGTALLVERGGT